MERSVGNIHRHALLQCRPSFRGERSCNRWYYYLKWAAISQTRFSAKIQADPQYLRQIWKICAQIRKSFYIFEKFSDLSLFFTIFLLFSHFSYETVKKIPPTGGAVSGKDGRKTLAGNSTLLLYYTLGGLINGNSEKNAVRQMAVSYLYRHRCTR